MSKPASRRDQRLSKRYAKERTLNLAAHIGLARRNISERFRVQAERTIAAITWMEYVR